MVSFFLAYKFQVMNPEIETRPQNTFPHFLILLTLPLFLSQQTKAWVVTRRRSFNAKLPIILSMLIPLLTSGTTVAVATADSGKVRKTWHPIRRRNRAMKMEFSATKKTRFRLMGLVLILRNLGISSRFRLGRRWSLRRFICVCRWMNQIRFLGLSCGRGLIQSIRVRWRFGTFRILKLLQLLLGPHCLTGGFSY